MLQEWELPALAMHRVHLLLCGRNWKTSGWPKHGQIGSARQLGSNADLPRYRYSMLVANVFEMTLQVTIAI